MKWFLFLYYSNGKTYIANKLCIHCQFNAVVNLIQEIQKCFDFIKPTELNKFSDIIVSASITESLVEIIYIFKKIMWYGVQRPKLRRGIWSHVKIIIWKNYHVEAGLLIVAPIFKTCADCAVPSAAAKILVNNILKWNEYLQTAVGSAGALTNAFNGLWRL